MRTLLVHYVPPEGQAHVIVSLYDCPECKPQPYMVHTSTNAGERNSAQLFRTMREAAAAWLDAITEAERQ